MTHVGLLPPPRVCPPQGATRRRWTSRASVHGHLAPPQSWGSALSRRASIFPDTCSPLPAFPAAPYRSNERETYRRSSRHTVSEKDQHFLVSGSAAAARCLDLHSSVHFSHQCSTSPAPSTQSWQATAGRSNQRLSYRQAKTGPPCEHEEKSKTKLADENQPAALNPCSLPERCLDKPRGFLLRENC